MKPFWAVLLVLLTVVPVTAPFSAVSLDDLRSNGTLANGSARALTGTAFVDDTSIGSKRGDTRHRGAPEASIARLIAFSPATRGDQRLASAPADHAPNAPAASAVLRI